MAVNGLCVLMCLYAPIHSFIPLRCCEQDTCIKDGWILSPEAVTKIGITTLAGVLQREVDKDRKDDNILFNSVSSAFATV